MEISDININTIHLHLASVTIYSGNFFVEIRLESRGDDDR